MSKRPGNAVLTCNAGEKLTSKTLYLAAWERHEAVALEEVKNTLTEQVCNYADMVPEIKGIS